MPRTNRWNGDKGPDPAKGNNLFRPAGERVEPKDLIHQKRKGEKVNLNGSTASPNVDFLRILGGVSLNLARKGT